MSELERLQRRAYGPGADIAEDATAMARLSELEAAQREPAPVVEDPTSPWWHRRPRLAVLGSAAALALIGALVTLMSQQLAPWSTPTETDTSTIETDSSMATMLPTGPDTLGPPVLTPDDMLRPHYVLALKSVGADADKPKDPHDTLNWLGLNTDELARYEDFRGLGVWGGKSRHGTACLLVAHPGQGFREGIGDEACSPEGLKTIAELMYNGDPAYSTGEVFTGLPPGGLIRFVFKGDHVDVHLYVRAADPIAPQG